MFFSNSANAYGIIKTFRTYQNFIKTIAKLSPPTQTKMLNGILSLGNVHSLLNESLILILLAHYSLHKLEGGAIHVGPHIHDRIALNTQ